MYQASTMLTLAPTTNAAAFGAAIRNSVGRIAPSSITRVRDVTGAPTTGAATAENSSIESDTRTPRFRCIAGSTQHRGTLCRGKFEAAANRVVRRRSGREMRRRKLERLARRAVDDNRMRDAAGRGIDDADADTIVGEVFVAPREQREQNRAKVESFARQHVFVARRVFAVRAAFQYPGVYQRAQAPGEYVRRDVKALLELLEASQPVQRVANEQDVPPVTDVLEAARDRAVHVFEALVTQ
jgi:hypothetical protein